MMAMKDMTEQEWLAERFRTNWMNFTVRDGHTPLTRKMSRKKICRKRRLFDCACFRSFWDFIPEDACRRAIVLFERFADGQATWTDLASIQAELVRVTKRDNIVQMVEDLIARDRVNRIDGTVRLIMFNMGIARLPRNENAESNRQCDLLRDIFGNPFRPITIDPRWLTSNVVDLAGAIYEERAFEKMPILADALMDAGCDSEEIISHCRSDGPHIRGCWVVDLLLGKQ